MKKISALIVLIITAFSADAQLRYDDGPIITGNERFVTIRSWGRSNITYSFQNGTGDIANNDERNAVRQAFQIWADYAWLTFTEVGSNGDIVISWATGNHGDGTSFDGVNGVLAHAFFPPPNGGSIAGDVHFDDDETWTLAEQAFGFQPIDLVTVAAHEIGHALGLDHSNVNCALMNPFYTGSHRYLAPDDIAGIRSLYGNRNPIGTSNVSCSGATLFINNIPTGATINWVSSNTAIATVANTGNQGVVSRTGTANGTVRITGTITLPCGLTVAEFIDLPIGAPMAADIIGMDPGVYLSAGQVLDLYINEPGSAYDWYIGGATILSGTTDPYITVKLDKCFPHQQAMNNFSAAVTYTNGCGTSPWKGENAYAVCGGGEDPEWPIRKKVKRQEAPAYNIFPNPAVNTVNITIPANGVAKTSVRIFDLHGKELKRIIPRSQVTPVSIGDLPRGTYIVEIYDGVKAVKEKLIKQ